MSELPLHTMFHELPLVGASIIGEEVMDIYGGA
jgi:hypothetical protein